jgi:hypothetical protein
MKITCYLGVIGSGKDHNANKMMLERVVPMPQLTRIDFKDALIEMVSDIVGYNILADYDWFKTHPVGVMRPADPFQETIITHEWAEIMRKHPGILTGRDVLVRVGTEAIRGRHPNYWVDEFEKRAVAAQVSDVVNSDTRFFNEIARIYRLSPVHAHFQFCNFKSDRYNAKLDHPSEKLAQTLLAIGLQDGQTIILEDFQKAAQIMGELFVLEAM